MPCSGQTSGGFVFIAGRSGERNQEPPQPGMNECCIWHPWQPPLGAGMSGTWVGAVAGLGQAPGELRSKERALQLSLCKVLLLFIQK